jgi:hypothetical protein
VAWVRDGFPPQTNIVRVNGQRSVLLTIQKAGNASTLNVIAGIKSLLPQIKTTVPPQPQIGLLCDQSIFVRGAISGVVRETLIAACLTAFFANLGLRSGKGIEGSREAVLTWVSAVQGGCAGLRLVPLRRTVKLCSSEQVERDATSFRFRQTRS